MVYVYSETYEGITITATPYYIPEKSTPNNHYYFFAYDITIKNHSKNRIRLLNRNWIIIDGENRERFIKGEGVAGKRPFLENGEEFKYQSFCPLSTPTGNMRGKFEFTSDSGERFWRIIPLFFLRVK